MRLKWMICCLAIAALAGSLPAAAEATPPRGLIVFLSDRSGNRALYTMWPDGSHLDGPIISFEDGTPWGPALSPDGSRIAFALRETTCVAVQCARHGNIWVANTDGSGLTQVTDLPGVNDWGPSWTPDGESVVFSRSIVGSLEWGDLYIATESASGEWTENVFSDRPGWESEAVFSPDGQKVAYVYVVDDDRFYNAGEDDYALENNDLVIADADASDGKQVRLPASEDGQPAWSPDGKLIAFSRWRIQPDWAPIGVWTIRRDGSHVRRVIAGSEAHDPTWSLDGNRIFFDSCYHITERAETCAIGRFDVRSGVRSVVEDADGVFDGMPHFGLRMVSVAR